jgi:hypothetical protein
MKLKVFSAVGVWLPCVPAAHRGNNYNCQFTILVRATTRKRVAELTGISTYVLRTFNCLNEAGPTVGYGNSTLSVSDIVQKDETIYYHAEYTRTGYLDQWFEYPRPRRR